MRHRLKEEATASKGSCPQNSGPPALGLSLAPTSPAPNRVKEAPTARWPCLSLMAEIKALSCLQGKKPPATGLWRSDFPALMPRLPTSLSTYAGMRHRMTDTTHKSLGRCGLCLGTPQHPQESRSPHPSGFDRTQSGVLGCLASNVTGRSPRAVYLSSTFPTLGL